MGERLCRGIRLPRLLPGCESGSLQHHLCSRSKSFKGQPNLANTHPFVWNGWMFMHNGTLTAFEKLQSKMLSEMPLQYRDLIRVKPIVSASSTG